MFFGLFFGLVKAGLVCICNPIHLPISPTILDRSAFVFTFFYQKRSLSLILIYVSFFSVFRTDGLESHLIYGRGVALHCVPLYNLLFGLEITQHQHASPII